MFLSYIANSKIKYGASVNVPFFFSVKVKINTNIARGMLQPIIDIITHEIS